MITTNNDNNGGYEDKTADLYRLVHDIVPFFMSSPRESAKSQLLLTLKAYWEGDKELFRGLEIEKFEENNPNAWQSYPVFYFDFTTSDYRTENALEEVIDYHLSGWEKLYGIDYVNDNNAVRFSNLIVRAKEITGKNCVVLVDEYDKAIFDLADDKEKCEHNCNILEDLFSVLKSSDGDLRFIFIIGKRKCHKAKMFNALDHLVDISFNDAMGI